MISKLKQACGFEYTSKLQRMFQDIGVSKDLNEQFRNHMANSNESLGKLTHALYLTELIGRVGPGIDFSIQVLSSGSWPFQQSFTFSLPSEVSFFYVIHCQKLTVFLTVGT